MCLLNFCFLPILKMPGSAAVGRTKWISVEGEQRQMQIKRCFFVVDDIKKFLLVQAFAFGFSLIEITRTSVDALIFCLLQTFNVWAWFRESSLLLLKYIPQPRKLTCTVWDWKTKQIFQKQAVCGWRQKSFFKDLTCSHAGQWEHQASY